MKKKASAVWHWLKNAVRVNEPAIDVTRRLQINVVACTSFHLNVHRGNNMTTKSTALPPEIHRRMMDNNPRYRDRVKKEEKARKQGKTPPGSITSNP